MEQKFIPRNKPSSTDTFCRDLLTRMVNDRSWMEQYEKETGLSAVLEKENAA